MSKRSPFKYFKTSPEITRLAVMMYVYFWRIAAHRMSDRLVRSGLIPLKKSSGLAVGERRRSTRGRVRSRWPRHLVRRDQLCELSEILRGGGEVEFVPGAVWSAQSKPVEFEDALEVGDEHLDLFPHPA